MTGSAEHEVVPVPEPELRDRVRRAPPTPRGRAEARATPPLPIGLSPAQVVELWRQMGRLRHVPTDLPTLDQVTRGGLGVPRRVVVVGAPGAGKTFLTTWWARRWAKAGAHVGMLAIDEDPEDITVRLAQMAGHTVASCEQRAPWDLERIALDLAELSTIRLYGAATTIEAAATNLARAGSSESIRVLIVDSLQTARCERAQAAEATERGPDERAIVSANIAAIREVATRHRLLVIATSEAPRSQYATVDQAASANRIASAKSSGAVEYGAQTLLYLSSVAGESDLVKVDIAKNRRGAAGPQVLHLRLNREQHTLAEVSDPRPAAASSRDAERAAKTSADLAKKVNEVAGIVYQSPGIGSRELRTRVQLKCGCGSTKAQLAIAAALDAGAIEDRPVVRGTVQDHHFHPAVRNDAPHLTDVSDT